MLSRPSIGEYNVLLYFVPAPSWYMLIYIPLNLLKPLATARVYWLLPTGMAERMLCMPWKRIGNVLEAKRWLE